MLFPTWVGKSRKCCFLHGVRQTYRHAIIILWVRQTHHAIFMLSSSCDSKLSSTDTSPCYELDRDIVMNHDIIDRMPTTIMLPKRRFGKDEQKMKSRFSTDFSMVRSQNRVLTPLKSASFENPDVIFCNKFCSSFPNLRLGGIKFTPPKRRFGKAEPTFQNAFSKHFSTIGSPNRILTPFKCASKTHSEMLARPSQIFVWGASSCELDTYTSCDFYRHIAMLTWCYIILWVRQTHTALIWTSRSPYAGVRMIVEGWTKDENADSSRMSFSDCGKPNELCRLNVECGFETQICYSHPWKSASKVYAPQTKSLECGTKEEIRIFNGFFNGS